MSVGEPSSGRANAINTTASLRVLASGGPPKVAVYARRSSHAASASPVPSTAVRRSTTLVLPSSVHAPSASVPLAAWLPASDVCERSASAVRLRSRVPARPSSVTVPPSVTGTEAATAVMVPKRCACRASSAFANATSMRAGQPVGTGAAASATSLAAVALGRLGAGGDAAQAASTTGRTTSARISAHC